MESGCQDISMVTTRGQDNFEKGLSSSQGGNQVEQLASLIQNILEQRMRQENQPNLPPPPPQHKQDASGIRGVPFAQIADRALDAEQAEKDVLDEEKVKRERLAREMQRGFRPGFQGNRGGQTQIQRPQDMKRKGAPTQQTRPDQVHFIGQN
ncbi:hypothetical protein PanWU01x14_225670 [Parasponia andersonii]|uniref:Uncharacterized protein n=1 Tax=Parasponia andersonii TaxID=3476 RepID=A0A2P5BMU2_PARAD|nr:hypothetical protein PanWU01x14_225670 [Parasponia andersonii]